MRIIDFTRLEVGSVLIGGNYEVALQVVHYQRTGLVGLHRAGDGCQTIRDFGSVVHDWFTRKAMFL